jgi:hypothetical protein
MRIVHSLLLLLLSAPVLAQTNSKPVATNKLPGSNCDNIVHNVLPPGASNRSPSECEVEFDRKVRTALRNAFQKTFLDFPETDWVISDTANNTLKEIGKRTEDDFFNPSYYFKIDMAAQSPAYRDWYNKFQAHMDELKNPKADSYKKFMDFEYAMNNAIHINFYIRVNVVSNSIYFMKGGHQLFTVPGAVCAVKGPKAGSLAGGGQDNARDGCLILFGTPKPAIKTEPGGGSSLGGSNNFPKNTSHLTVQNISIRIECNNELLDKIVKDTDFKAIADLVGK